MERFDAFVRRIGHRPWFAAVGRRLAPLDGLLYRLTGGRVTVAAGTGLRELVLTTRGRRSGLLRPVPLLYVRDGDAYVVVASNWGQPHHPAWSGNLLAEPAARVTVGRTELPVRARLAVEAERARLWPQLTRMWPAYDTYAGRSGRDLRVFVLEPDPLRPTG